MPEESQNVQVPQANTPSVLDKPVPNPLAKNPNVYTHKVFAAVGLILIGVIIATAGIWWYVENQSGTKDDKVSTTNTSTKAKTATSSAQTDTSSSKKDETDGWQTYTSSQLAFSIKYPKELKNIKEQLSTTNSQIPTISFSDNADFNSIDPKITTVDVSKGDFKASYDAISLLEINKMYSRSVAEASNVAEETRLTDISVDGQVGIKQSYVPSTKGEGNIDYTMNVYVKKGSDYYKISIISGTKTNYEQNQKIFDLMISTFKFI